MERCQQVVHLVRLVQDPHHEQQLHPPPVKLIP